MSFQPIEVVVKRGDAGQRLDQFLPRALGRLGVEASRRRLRKLIEQGAVYIDGRRVRVVSRQPSVGARVVLRADPRSQAPTRPPWELESSAILFDDDALLVVDKPSGLATQARQDDARDNLLAAAERYLKERGEPTRLYAVHRLDRGTSGVTVLAKRPTVAADLGTALAERRVLKVYRAVVSTAGGSSPDTWTVHNQLTTEPLPGGRRRSVAVESGGREAETVFRTLAVADGGEDRAWIEARPKTGRTHQIRAHLADSGWPVLGDRLYGEWVERPRGRLMLHAHRLELVHPVTGEPLNVESPLPEGFGQAG